MRSRPHSVDAQLLGLALDSSEVGSSDEKEIEVECTSCRIVICQAGGGGSALRGRSSSRARSGQAHPS